MKALVVGLLQQRERMTMGTFTIGLVAVVFVALAGLVACNDKETDERLTRAGWLPIRVWEHDDIDAAAELVAAAVRSRTPTRSIT